MKLAERVKLKRKELEMSQDELASRMGYKSRTSINKIEMGRPVSQKIIVRLAESLGVTPSYLMGWEDEENEKQQEESIPNVAAYDGFCNDSAIQIQNQDEKIYPFIRTKKEKHEFPAIKRIFVLFFLFFALQNRAKQDKNWLKSYAKLTLLTQKLRTF